MHEERTLPEEPLRRKKGESSGNSTSSTCESYLEQETRVSVHKLTIEMMYYEYMLDPKFLVI